MQIYKVFSFTLVSFLLTIFTPHLVGATVKSPQSPDLHSTQNSSFNKAEIPYQIAKKPINSKQPAVPSPILNTPNLSCLSLSPAPRLFLLTSSPDKMLSEIAIPYASIGQYDQSLKIAQTIQDKNTRADTLVKIASLYIKAGQPKPATQLLSQALQLAQTQKDEYQRADLVAEIAANLAAAGQLSEALRLAQSLKYGSEKAFSGIAEHYIQAGQYNQAVQLAQSISNSCTKAQTLQGIVSHLLEAKQYNLALQVAQTIEDQFNRDEGLRDIASKLAETGQYDQALQVAQTISSDLNKAEALTKIAVQLAKAGQANKASDLLSQALNLAKSTSNYGLPMPPVLPAPPSYQNPNL